MNSSNYDDKSAESLGLKKWSLDDIKKELKLPNNAEFCGYLIYIEASDEFLQEVTDTPTATKRAFVKMPDLAKRFETFDQAYKYVRAEKDEIVVVLFDIGKQYMVFQVNYGNN
jgi:hypothetical protein